MQTPIWLTTWMIISLLGIIAGIYCFWAFATHGGCQKRAQRLLASCREGDISCAFEIEGLTKQWQNPLLTDDEEKEFRQYLNQARHKRRTEMIEHGKGLLSICRRGKCYPCAGDLVNDVIIREHITHEELGTTEEEVDKFFQIYLAELKCICEAQAGG